MNKAAVVFGIWLIGMAVLWWNDFGNIRMPPFIDPMSLALRHRSEGSQQYIKYAFFDPLRYIICMEAGILMVCGSITWCYWKATRNLKDTQAMIMASFTCSLMPLFELLNLSPWWWILLVLIPSVVLAALWMHWHEIRKKNIFYIWDDVGLWMKGRLSPYIDLRGDPKYEQREEKGSP